MTDFRQVWLKDPATLASRLLDLEMVVAAGHCLAPVIPDGALLFVDHGLEPQHGDYVLLRLPEPIAGTRIDTQAKQFQIAADGTRLICNSAGRFRLAFEIIEGVVVAFADLGQPSELGATVDAAHAKTVANIARMRGVSVADHVREVAAARSGVELKA